MLAFPSLCLTSLSQSPLWLDLTTVSPAPPFSLKSSKSPRSARSTANAIVVEGRWLCGHNSLRSGQCGLWCRRFGGFSAADALATLEDGVAHKHGDHAIAHEGSFSPTSSRRFVRLMLLPIGGYVACALHPCE